MPTISLFYGIYIGMFYNDHNPPHFHAQYAEQEAEFNLESLEVIKGSLPRRAENLVREWALLHQEELRENWRRARAGDDVLRIQGLR